MLLVIFQKFIDIDCLFSISYRRNLVGLDLLIGYIWVLDEEVIVYKDDENDDKIQCVGQDYGLVQVSNELKYFISYLFYYEEQQYLFKELVDFR